MYIHEKYNVGQKCAYVFQTKWKKNQKHLKQEKLNTDNIKIVHTENKLYSDLEKIINVINLTSQLSVHYRNTLFIVVCTDRATTTNQEKKVEV